MLICPGILRKTTINKYQHHFLSNWHLFPVSNYAKQCFTWSSYITNSTNKPLSRYSLMPWRMFSGSTYLHRDGWSKCLQQNKDWRVTKLIAIDSITAFHIPWQKRAPARRVGANRWNDFIPTRNDLKLVVVQLVKQIPFACVE